MQITNVEANINNRATADLPPLEREERLSFTFRTDSLKPPYPNVSVPYQLQSFVLQFLTVCQRTVLFSEPRNFRSPRILMQ
jgi:hypothetical protein